MRLGAVNWKKNQLAEIADTQAGYFTAGQAAKIGYTHNHHSYHLSKGNWYKIETGLFRLPGYQDTMESEFIKWSLWSRNQNDQPLGIISHHSALAYFALGEYNPRAIHLTVPPRFRKALPPEVVVHKASLNLSELELKTGFMVTRLAKTLADLKPWLNEHGRWEAVGTQALATEKLSPEEYRLLGFPQNSGPQDESLVPDVEALGPSNPTLMRERIYRMIFQRTQARNIPSRRRAQAGFTLVELLVVVAIISVLAALLLPALNNVHQQAQSIECLSNLRQMAVSSQMYVDDHNGFVHPNHNGAGTFWATLLHAYFQNERLMDCAAAKPPRWTPSSTRYSSYQLGHAYWYNTAVRTFTDGSDFTRQGVKLEMYAAPSETVHLVDGGDGFQIIHASTSLFDLYGNPPTFDSNSSGCGKAIARHLRKGNVDFADGRAKSLDWPELFKLNSAGRMPYFTRIVD